MFIVGLEGLGIIWGFRVGCALMEVNETLEVGEKSFRLK